MLLLLKEIIQFVYQHILELLNINLIIVLSYVQYMEKIEMDGLNL